MMTMMLLHVGMGVLLGVGLGRPPDVWVVTWQHEHAMGADLPCLGWKWWQVLAWRGRTGRCGGVCGFFLYIDSVYVVFCLGRLRIATWSWGLVWTSWILET